MATVVHYYPGGLIPQAPQQNRSELWDTGSGVYITWDPAGVQTGRRPLTADELADLTAVDVDATETVNQAAFEAKAQAGLAANATFLALTTPTNPQVLAQVQLLTKETSALIRLALSLFDSTAGT